jgi:hypothetical protein
MGYTVRTGFQNWRIKTVFSTESNLFDLIRLDNIRQALKVLETR